MDVAREDDLGFLEIEAEKQLAHKSAHRDASLSLVVVEDVLVARGIVEFLGVSLDKAVGVGEFSVVDLRPGDLDVGDGSRRNVLDHEGGQTFLGELVDRPLADPVTVGIGQVLVDPDAAGQAFGGELPGRQAHLPVLAVDPIAVVVHVHEIVVGADDLELPVGLEQRLVVPQPNVLRGLFVLLQRLGGQVLQGRELLLFHPVDPVGHAGVLDRVFDVGALLADLVGGHLEGLNQVGVPLVPHEAHPQQNPDPGQGQGELGAEGAGHHQPRGHQADEDHQGQDRELGMDVGEAGSVYHAPVGIEEVVLFQVVVNGPPCQECSHQAEQMETGRRDHAGAAPGDLDTSLNQVDRGSGDGRKDQQSPSELIDELVEGQGEEVEPDVLLEEGIDAAVGHGVLIGEIDIPFCARPAPHDVGNENGAAQQELAEHLVHTLGNFNQVVG